MDERGCRMFGNEGGVGALHWQRGWPEDTDGTGVVYMLGSVMNKEICLEE